MARRTVHSDPGFAIGLVGFPVQLAGGQRFVGLAIDGEAQRQCLVERTGFVPAVPPRGRVRQIAKLIDIEGVEEHSGAVGSLQSIQPRARDQPRPLRCGVPCDPISLGPALRRIGRRGWLGHGASRRHYSKQRGNDDRKQSDQAHEAPPSLTCRESHRQAESFIGCSAHGSGLPYGVPIIFLMEYVISAGGPAVRIGAGTAPAALAHPSCRPRPASATYSVVRLTYRRATCLHAAKSWTPASPTRRRSIDVFGGR